MTIVRSTRNTDSGKLHSAMIAAKGRPVAVVDLAKQAGTTIERAAYHCDYWSKPKPQRGVHQAAYIRKGNGWIVAPGIVIHFR